MKKVLISYSSLSGNTRQLAEGIAKSCPDYIDLLDIAKLEEGDEAVAEALANYDHVLHGYWVDKGGPDARSERYLKAIRNKKVGIFATLGAYPDSDHAKESLERGRQCLDASNEFLAEFICQGRLSEAIKQRIRSLPADHPHAVDEERLKRWAAAEDHPNEQDIQNAIAVFSKLFHGPK